METARRLWVGQSRNKSCSAHMVSNNSVGPEVYLSSCPTTDPTLSSPDKPDLPQDEAQVVPELAAREEFSLRWKRPMVWELESRTQVIAAT